jgi:hypothetical protein
MNDELMSEKLKSGLKKCGKCWTGDRGCSVLSGGIQADKEHHVKVQMGKEQSTNKSSHK